MDFYSSAGDTPFRRKKVIQAEGSDSGAPLQRMATSKVPQHWMLGLWLWSMVLITFKGWNTRFFKNLDGGLEFIGSTSQRMMRDDIQAY